MFCWQQYMKTGNLINLAQTLFCGASVLTLFQVGQVGAQTVSIGSSSSTVHLQLTGSAGSTQFEVISGAVISASPVGISANTTRNWILENNGYVTGSNDGMRLHSAGQLTLVNNGTVIGNGTGTGGTAAGINLQNGKANVTNNGLVQSNSDGIYVSTAGSTIINHGTIETKVTAVYFLSGGTFTQSATGVLTTRNGTTSYGVIANSGSLTGSNAGLIDVYNAAVWYRGNSNGTFTNSGTVSGGRQGVLMNQNAGARLTFNNTGTIYGGSQGVLIQYGGGNSSQIKLDNSGDISGGMGIRFETNGNTLVNTGTIRSTAGDSGTALSITGSNNTITLGENSQLVGDAVSTGSNNILTLTGSSVEDSSFTGFSTLTMQGNIWELTGNVSLTSNSASATSVSSGTLVISGTLTNGSAGGAYIASGATLQIGNNGTSGDVSGQISNDGTLAFKRSDVYIYSNVVTGNGNIEQRGTGTTILTADNTNTGGTVISTGRLQLGNGGTTGSVIGNILDNGHLIFSRSDIYTQSGSISGTGTLEQAGTSTLILTADNTYAGITTISSGILQVGNGGTSGTLGTGNIVDNAALIFNRSDTVIQSGAISGTGTLEQAGFGTLILAADNSYAGGTTISAGTLQLGNGGITGSVSGNILNNGHLVFNRLDVHTYGGIISGSGSLEQAGYGTTILTAVHTYSGITNVAVGTLVIGDDSSSGAALTGGGNLTVATGAVLGGYGSVTGNVTNDGILAVGAAISALAGGPLGNFTINGDVWNNGHIQLGSGTVAGNRMTITGNYTGSSAAINMNAVLNGDGSLSDRLVLSGTGYSTYGTTSLFVTNVGGAGMFTAGNGIQVVETTGGATTGNDTFVLGAPVVAGPYEYSLYHGARDGSDPQGWYLRNDLVDPPGNGANNGGGGGGSGSDIPDYRQEISVYSTLHLQAQGYGRTLIGSLHERTGDRWGHSGADDAGNSRQKPGWGRIAGQRNSWSNGAGIYDHDGAAYRQNVQIYQVGLDLYCGEWTEGSVDSVGTYISFGNSQADIWHYDGQRAGGTSMDAWAAGIYWTHRSAQGWYTDAVMQTTRYSADQNGERGYSLKTHGYGFAASLESGYAIQFLPGFIIEPQAQIVYQDIRFSGGYDRAAYVWFDDSQSLAGRLGIRLARDWGETDIQQSLVIWARLDVWHEFLGENTMKVSSAGEPVSFGSDMGGTWAAVLAGVDYRLSEKTALFAAGGYEFGFTGDRHSYNGKAGLRITW